MELLAASTLVLLVAAALVGVFVGMCSGLLGIGGGMIMVPLFRLAFGLSPISATATSLFAIIPTSISGGIQRIRNHTCILKMGIAMGIGGAVSSSLGVALAQVVPGWTVMVVAALVIGYSAFTTFQKARGKASSGNAVKTEGPSSDGEFERRHYIVGAAIGFVAGFFSGFIGVGGGFIMVPLMMAFANMSMRMASGTSLVAIMFIATPAAIEQCILGNVNYVVGIAMICGSIPGAIVGGRLANRIPERELRLVFAGFLLLAAILLVVKELGVF